MHAGTEVSHDVVEACKAMDLAVLLSGNCNPGGACETSLLRAEMGIIRFGECCMIMRANM